MNDVNSLDDETGDDLSSQQDEGKPAGEIDDQKRAYAAEFLRREKEIRRRTTPWRCVGWLALALLLLYALLAPWERFGLDSFTLLPFLVIVGTLASAAAVGIKVIRTKLKCPKCHRELSKLAKGHCPHCAITLLSEEDTQLASLQRRRRYMMWATAAVVAIASVAVSWLGAGLHRAHKNLLAANEILRIKDDLSEAGGQLYVVEVRPRWFGRLLGDPGFLYPESFQVVDPDRWAEEDLAQLKKLPGTLIRVTLRDSQITDAGLVHLEDARIMHLDLSGTGVTDAGLGHLEKLRALMTLDLGRTQVTEQGVKRLREALPKCKISY